VRESISQQVGRCAWDCRIPVLAFTVQSVSI